MTSMSVAKRGKTAAFCKERVVCAGGGAGLGLKPYDHGWIEKFLSTGEGIPRDGEKYKKTPELALEFMDGIPVVERAKYVVMQPLDEVDVTVQEPEVVVFMVDPDRFSALATLANFDTHTQDIVKLIFGAGCTQSVLYAMASQEKKEPL